MSDETASTIILVGAIFQVLASMIILFLGGAGFLIPIIFGGTIDLWILIPAFFFVGGIISLVFTILWLSWRHDPSAHKTALIITGLLGLVFGGFLPSLFILIGSAIAGGNGA